MSLPYLLSEIGTYFQDLQIPNFCLGPPMVIEQRGAFPRIIFDAKALPNCSLVLILVWFTRDGFVEGQNFILINRLRHEIERINPLPQYFGSLSADALIDAGLAGFKFSSVRPEDLPPGYFSFIYYLQTRLMNPTLSREELLQVLKRITPEMINQYRDRLLGFIPPPTPNTGRGLILCSGRVSPRDIPTYIPQGINWVTVNDNLQSEPDLLGSYSSFPSLQQLGLFSWDYVYVRGCPIGLSPVEYQNIIRAGRWLLKRGGHLYIPNYYLRSQDGIPEAIRLRQTEAETQIERIRQEEFFSKAEMIGRQVKMTV